MPTLASTIQQALERLIAGTANNEDQVILSQAKSEGQLILALGERSIAIGGNVTRSIIIAGDIRIDLSPEAYERLTAQLFPKALHTLRAPTADFTGRETEVEQLLARLSGGEATALISGIRGMGGVGKTELALYVAHKLTPHYPDAQLFIELQQAGEPIPAEALLGKVIHAFEPLASLPDTLPELQALYRATLQSRRGLLLLDNAYDAAQVRPLLPPPAGWAVMVTSRHHFSLPGASLLDLNVMSDDDARILAGRLLRDAGRTATDDQVRQLVELCGHLPLALRVAAGYLSTYRDWTIDEYLTALQAERLAHLEVEDESVAGVLGLSVGQLERENMALALHWRELAVFPAPFDRAAAAAVWDVPEGEAHSSLSALVQQSLVDYDLATNTYSVHDLLHEYALRPTGADSQVPANGPALRLRHAEHYLSIGISAEVYYLHGGSRALQGLHQFDEAWPHLRSAWEWVTTQEGSSCDRWLRRLAIGTANLLSLRCHPQERIIILEPSLRASLRLHDREVEGAVLGSLGNANADLGDARRAIECYKASLAIARELDSTKYMIANLTNLASMCRCLGEVPQAISHAQEALGLARRNAYSADEFQALDSLASSYSSLGDIPGAIELYEQALDIARQTTDRRGQARVLANIGHALGQLGRAQEASEYVQEALAIFRAIGDRRGESSALGNLGALCGLLGQAEQAIFYLERALAIGRQTGDRRSQASSLSSMGTIYGRLGNLARAIQYQNQAIEAAREIGDRSREGLTLGNLGTSYLLMNDVARAVECYESAMAIDQEIGDRWNEAADAWNLAGAYERLGELAKAVELAQITVDYERSIGHADAEDDARLLEVMRHRAQGGSSAADEDVDSSKGG